MSGISKSFGRVRALSGVDFDVAPGEVHALLGENGAGKSTLMGALFGLVAIDSGTIEIFGRKLDHHTPRESLDAGIGLVQQHFSLVARMTVAEHVALGRPGFRFDRARARELVRQTCQATGLVVDPDARASSLSAGLRQRLEIIKALSRDVRVLILDEPTAMLAPQEVDELFAALRRLAANGMSIVMITHRLAEVTAIATRVTVLRRGEVAVRGKAADFTPAALAAAVIGESDPVAAASPSGVPTARQATALVARDVTVRVHGAVRVQAATFSVRAGEIVGVAAVEGNGQRELLRAVAGLEPYQGTVELGPGGGVGFIPEDRQAEGLIMDFTITENLALDASTGFWLRRDFLEHQGAVAIDEYAIKVPDANKAVRTLSGGNQQKVVLARVLARSHALLIAENPTRGLDIRAAADVKGRIRAAAHDKGAGVLFYSSDLDEVLELSDRVGVMSGGRWYWAEGADRTRERIGAMMLGAAA